MNEAKPRSKSTGPLQPVLSNGSVDGLVKLGCLRRVKSGTGCMKTGWGRGEVRGKGT